MDGLVDVCLNGTYSSVCITGWSVDEASVVCRQRGFPTGWATVNMCTRIEKQFICITTLIPNKKFQFYFVVLYAVLSKTKVVFLMTVYIILMSYCMQLLRNHFSFC